LLAELENPAGFETVGDGFAELELLNPDDDGLDELELPKLEDDDLDEEEKLDERLEEKPPPPPLFAFTTPANTPEKPSVKIITTAKSFFITHLSG